MINYFGEEDNMFHLSNFSFMPSVEAKLFENLDYEKFDIFTNETNSTSYDFDYDKL